jgi:hypothetical protein
MWHAGRIEEKAIAIVKEPVRLRVRNLTLLNCLVDDVYAPVTLDIDGGIWILQDISDVSSEIQNVLPTPPEIA